MEYMGYITILVLSKRTKAQSNYWVALNNYLLCKIITSWSNLQSNTSVNTKMSQICLRKVTFRSTNRCLSSIIDNMFLGTVWTWSTMLVLESFSSMHKLLMNWFKLSSSLWLSMSLWIEKYYHETNSSLWIKIWPSCINIINLSLEISRVAKTCDTWFENVWVYIKIQ